MKKVPCTCKSDIPNDDAIEAALERRANFHAQRMTEMSLERFWEGIEGKELYPEVFEDGFPGPGPIVSHLDSYDSCKPMTMVPRGVPCVPCKNKG